MIDKKFRMVLNSKIIRILDYQDDQHQALDNIQND